MANNPRPSRRSRPLAIVGGDDPLPEVRIDGVDTVPMTEEQYTAAVHALATLIDAWRLTTHTGTAHSESGAAGRSQAA